jgi:hypothetical protein
LQFGWNALAIVPIRARPVFNCAAASVVFPAVNQRTAASAFGGRERTQLPPAIGVPACVEMSVSAR